jgi:hypothetical protein
MFYNIGPWSQICPALLTLFVCIVDKHCHVVDEALNNEKSYSIANKFNAYQNSLLPRVPRHTQ